MVILSLMNNTLKIEVTDEFMDLVGIDQSQGLTERQLLEMVRLSISSHLCKSNFISNKKSATNQFPNWFDMIFNQSRGVDFK